MTELINKDFESYEDTALSDLESYSNPKFIVDDASFFLAIQNRDQINCFHGRLYNNTNSFIRIITENYEKEKFYLTAIENLLKQKRYLNLMYEFSNELITAEEFDKELEENETKYLIEANKTLDNLNSISALIKVLGKIKEDFTNDDLSEIFSIEDPEIFTTLELFFHSKSLIKGNK